MSTQNPHSPLLSTEELKNSLTALPDWEVLPDGQSIQKEYPFKNYYETMAFVNAVAWIAHQKDHHPDMEVGYKTCTVTYSTHSAGGITAKDIESASRIEDL